MRAVGKGNIAKKWITQKLLKNIVKKQFSNFFVILI